LKFVGVSPGDRETSVTRGLEENDHFHCGVISDIIESRGIKNRLALATSKEGIDAFS
jgi:hypothetical protein